MLKVVLDGGVVVGGGVGAGVVETFSVFVSLEVARSSHLTQTYFSDTPVVVSPASSHKQINKHANKQVLR